MKQEQAVRYLKNLRFIQAIADGKTLQFRSRYSGEWFDIEDPSLADDEEYRIKPVPKPPVYELREWKREEVPIGAYFKSSKIGRHFTLKDSDISRITGYHPSYSNIKYPAIMLNGGADKYLDHYFIGDLITSLSEPVWSWDGINWHRCGVWVQK